MKIGYLTSSVSRSAGGLYDAMRFLALAMHGQYADIHVFGLNDKNTEDDLPGWDDLSVDVFKIKGPAFFGFAPKLYDALLTSQLDVIHSHGLWTYPSVASLQWAKRTGRPYLISPHGMLDPWAVRNSQWKKRLAGWLYENAHLRAASCLHALCESEAQAIRAYGLSNPICIIPNGIHQPAETDVEPLLWQQQLPTEAKVILYLGRLHPKKGLLQLLEAWSLAHGSAGSESWHLAIAGWDQGGHEQTLKALARDLNIQESVHFIGAQFGQQKHACYRHADAFILPSFSEGLPMTVLEAWSYGLTVLMTPQCNLPEGFQANAALRIEPEAHSVANGLIELFGLTEIERNAIGERGKTLTEERFSWSHIAEQMTSVYRWVLGDGPKPNCIICD